MRKIKYIDIESISMYYNLYYRLITKETNYAQIVFKILKIYVMVTMCFFINILNQ